MIGTYICIAHNDRCPLSSRSYDNCTFVFQRLLHSIKAQSVQYELIRGHCFGIVGRMNKYSIGIYRRILSSAQFEPVSHSSPTRSQLISLWYKCRFLSKICDLHHYTFHKFFNIFHLVLLVWNHVSFLCLSVHLCFMFINRILLLF